MLCASKPSFDFPRLHLGPAAMTKAGEDALGLPLEAAWAEESSGRPAVSQTPEEGHSSDALGRWGVYQPAVIRFVRTRSPAARIEAKQLFEEMAAQRASVAEALATCSRWLVPVLRSSTGAGLSAALESSAELHTCSGKRLTSGPRPRPEPTCGWHRLTLRKPARSTRCSTVCLPSPSSRMRDFVTLRLTEFFARPWGIARTT